MDHFLVYLWFGTGYNCDGVTYLINLYVRPASVIIARYVPCPRKIVDAF